ncbi:MAG: VWA domain-containing protein [Myxococcales bacterium]|nr:VWA domain-containing protein [Myxococcales bacterium]
MQGGLKSITLILRLFLLAALTAGCGDDSDGGQGGSSPETGSGKANNLGQPGAQDFGLFRQILENGEIPSPETLDAVGFFNEHKLQFPEPKCGQNVCLHGSLGVMGNLMTGTNCTMVMMGMNTSLTVDSKNRPPLQLVIAIDTSGSMLGEPLSYVKGGLQRMVDELLPNDMISIVRYGSVAEIVAEAVPATDRQALLTAISGLDAQGATNIFAGLFTALTLAEKHFDPSRQNRVILLSDGVMTAGIQEKSKLLSLAKGYAGKGVALTTIGVGEEFDVDLMEDLGEVGAGNFYFLEDARSVLEVFTEEVKVFMVPVALDVSITFSAGPAYGVREAFGTHAYSGGPTGGEIYLPALFLAGRTDDTQPEIEGRRGGGGAIIVELMPKFSAVSGVPGSGEQTDINSTVAGDLYRVGTLYLTWKEPATGQVFSQTVEVDNPDLPGEWPQSGTFTTKTTEKAFVMLNLYTAFRSAAELATDGDTGSALAILEAIRPAVANWLKNTEDFDIQDDLKYVDLFINTLASLPNNVIPTVVPEPWPWD